MSIFNHSDIDFILIKFLEIDDLRNLYQTNTYYYKLIKPILTEFITFYSIQKNIELPDWVDEKCLFSKAFQFGNLEICKYLDHINYHTTKIKYDKSFNIASFNIASFYGHLHIVQWLYSIRNIDIRDNDNFAFELSCKNGHLNVA